MMEKQPPTQDALLQHIKRAVYQARILATSKQAQQVLPSLKDYGCTKESGSWKPVWLVRPWVAESAER